MGISVGTGIVSAGMGVGAGVEVGTAVAAAVIIAVVSIGVVVAGVRLEQAEDSIIMVAIKIASTLVKRFVFIFLCPFRNVIDWIFCKNMRNSYDRLAGSIHQCSLADTCVKIMIHLKKYVHEQFEC